MLDREELIDAIADLGVLEREHERDLKSIASRYVDPDALEDCGHLYAASFAGMYEVARPEAAAAEVSSVHDAATDMFAIGFVVACHALRRERSAV